ncbi:hypothetical protein [Halobaculum sp. D14]|uniref:hypothetical protein n=1 Tax=unclassified Halobaculum TaxID=2640896 RepID=UPI003EB94D68
MSTADDTGGKPTRQDETRLWLVERTYGDDELNLIILVYATTDGERYFRKERALTSFADDRPTRASVVVPDAELGSVDDEEQRARYETEATRMAATHDPDESL